MAVQDNVVFAFVKIQRPVKSMNEGSTEFTVDCIMSKADAKAWNKAHKGNAYKIYDNDEFLEKFHLDEIPFPDQDEQYAVKFKKYASKDGVSMPDELRPRVFEVVNGKNVDVTFSKLVANGSKGRVSFSTFSNSYGEFVQLTAIQVTSMIEYQVTSVGSDFGEVELAEVPESAKQVVNKQSDPVGDDFKRSNKPEAKPATPNKPKRKVDSEGDSPF